jgi:hypothetical protein
MKHSRYGSLCALALLTLSGAACTSAAYDSSYYDPYVYYTYYPTDVYYSSYYWTDPYYYYYSSLADGVSGDAGVDGGSNAGRQSVGDAIRALARGEDVCANQVTVTPKTASNPCPGTGADTIRSGVTLVFNQCNLPNGGTLDGTIDVQSTRTASDATCVATTTITVSHTTTITNLAYTGPSGRRFVVPNETGTGTTTFVNGQRPATAASTFSGRMQIFGNGGATPAADQAFNGDVMLTPGANGGSYTMDGAVTLDDQLKSGMTTLTATGITRSGDCCRPTAGSITYLRTGQMPGGPHTWSFHPGCGMATFDGNSTDVAPCP